MADKHTKNWLIAFVLALSVTGGIASYLSQENVFFIGTEKQNLLASVLGRHFSAYPNNAAQPQPYFQFSDQEIAAANMLRLDQTAKELGVQTAEETAPGAEPLPAKPKLKPVSSPCGPEETAVFKNGKFSECRKLNVIASQPELAKQSHEPVVPLSPAPVVRLAASVEASQLAPAPKFRLSNNLQPTTYNPSSCSSQSLFTYTGPDREGLLYGMCIKCPMEEYVFNNGKCGSDS